MWWGLGACATYVVLSLVLGERLPFSRYEMYATAGHRTEGAVPIFLVEGERANPLDYGCFSGLDVHVINSDGWPCFELREVHETHRWIRENRHDPPAGPGVEAAWGYDLVSVNEQGEISRRREILTRGRAWSRS